MKRSALKRTGPLRRSPMSGQRKALPRVNRKRAAKRRELAFGGAYRDFVASQHCCACGAPGPSDPHHYVSRGAGGDYRHMVPLDRACHQRSHQIGQTTFQQERGIDFSAVASRLLLEWSLLLAAA